MRKAYLIAPLLCCAILFLSNTSHSDFVSTLFLIGGQNDPVLPEVPHDYANISIPEHLRDSPYGTNDTTVFDNITNEAATLGRVLFYDELLSANENLSCATCHQQHLSFADETAFSAGVSEDTKRNSMQLNDLGWSNKIAFFWDLSHGNLEEMIALPLENTNEIGVTDLPALLEKMEETNYYPDLFVDAYGVSEISMEKIQDALGQFIRSMVTFDTKFDQSERGELSLSESERNGLELFSFSCEVCHLDGAHVIDFGVPEPLAYPGSIEIFAPIFSNELHEEEDLGAGDWDAAYTGLFKSPTLRNIEKTTPYMHDGRFETLREVIDHYSEGIEESEWGMLPEGGFQFDEKQKVDLEAFLLTLTDESFLTEERWSDPFSRLSTGLEETPITSAKVYPNPSNGLTYIDFENTSGKKVVAYLMNIEGKVVRKLSTHKSGFATDVSQLPAGMYIVRIMNGEEFLDKQLIVSP